MDKHSNDKQGKSYHIVMMNPELTPEEVVKKLRLSPSVKYICMADEITSNGTPHRHVYVKLDSCVRHSTLRKRFKGAHIESAKGSAQQNREYILKGGKWSDTEKADTSVEGSFYEWGTLPEERKAASKSSHASDTLLVIEAIKSGLSNTEIISAFPKMFYRIRDIELFRQNYLAERYSTEMRELEVSYIFGATGTGKTYGIYQNHNADDICRITDYRIDRGIQFDAYKSHDVLVLEEFESQVPIQTMLNLLDVYPLQLSARYMDKTACFTKVYITSNSPLSIQYANIQKSKPETWNAFLRRIDHVFEYKRNGVIVEHKPTEYRRSIK